MTNALLDAALARAKQTQAEAARALETAEAAADNAERVYERARDDVRALERVIALITPERRDEPAANGTDRVAVQVLPIGDPPTEPPSPRYGANNLISEEMHHHFARLVIAMTHGGRNR